MHGEIPVQAYYVLVRAGAAYGATRRGWLWERRQGRQSHEARSRAQIENAGVDHVRDTSRTERQERSSGG